MIDTLKQAPIIDLVAFDKQDQPVLAVEVKVLADVVQIAREWLAGLDSTLRSAGRPIPYWMFVDLDKIFIFTFEDGNGQPSTCCFIPTPTVLNAYDPDFSQKRIFDDYLLALVEAWLRDFAFDWRSADPPALKEMAEIGLAERLKGGMTHREVSLADLYSLRGNQLRDEPFPGSGPRD